MGSGGSEGSEQHGVWSWSMWVTVFIYDRLEQGIDKIQRLCLRSTEIKVLLLHFFLPFLTEATHGPLLVSARISLTPPFLQRMFRQGAATPPHTEEGSNEQQNQDLNPAKAGRSGVLYSPLQLLV